MPDLGSCAIGGKKYLLKHRQLGSLCFRVKYLPQSFILKSLELTLSPVGEKPSLTLIQNKEATLKTS
jgi:hypothetical protein